MSKGKPTRPRNQLGEFATRKPQETIARLKEKVSKNHTAAQPRTVQAQISESWRLRPSRAVSVASAVERPRYDEKVT